jgi:hypothetical protein
MYVTPDTTNCVAFVAEQLVKWNDGDPCEPFTPTTHRLCGTGFFIGLPTPERYLVTHFVTARHTIEAIRDALRQNDGRAYLRVNLKSAAELGWIRTEISEWHLHPDPNVDVAIYAMDGWPVDLDHSPVVTETKFWPGSLDPHTHLWPGVDLHLPGLFTKHAGNYRNLPIVRFGQIAAVPREKFSFKGKSAPYYIAELRSIGGLSGSPVFVHLPERISNPTPNPEIFESLVEALRYNMSSSDYLVGFASGHWDEEYVTVANPDSPSREKINVGLAVITPTSTISETLATPSLKAHYDKILHLIETDMAPGDAPPDGQYSVLGNPAPITPVHAAIPEALTTRITPNTTQGA